MDKIARLISNSMALLGRKIDNLIYEIKLDRSKKQPIQSGGSKIDVNVSDNVAHSINSAMRDGMTDIKDVLKNLKIPEPRITLPDQKAPVVNVAPPVVKIPKFNIPAPIVNVPPANITVEPTPVNFPNTMKVEGMDDLIESVNREAEKQNVFEGVDSKSPLAVMVVDSKGKRINDFGGEFTAPSTISLRVGTTLVSDSNPLPTTTDGFSIPRFDTQIIDESAAPATTTITYKLSGVTVATKVITVVGTLTTITVTIA